MSGPLILSVHDGGDRVWGVASLEGGGDDFQSEPCARCPWRKDAPVGAFPAEVYRHSARTSYDMSDQVFGCHAAGSRRPRTCAGFLLRGAAHNLAIRLRLSRVDFSAVHSPVELYDNYRAMAVANGVSPDDPALAACRDDEFVTYFPYDGDRRRR
ncbi:hypothetical protein GCM10009560_15530 [Nonomuraea longicatena]|uniref:Uncharacterized protein n=2 Tax=Nonomuraea longicatena TaxID=83682 RepID=A0ABP3ZCH5_9ACTN